MDIDVLDPKTDPRYPLARALRHRVLRAPLCMAPDTVGFPGEETAVHVIACDGDHVIGTVSFDFGSGRLRAMAVAPEWQGRGVGARLVARLEGELVARGVSVIELHARADAVGFYEKIGYGVFGEPFIEVTIPHRAMRKTL